MSFGRYTIQFNNGLQGGLWCGPCGLSQPHLVHFPLLLVYVPATPDFQLLKSTMIPQTPQILMSRVLFPGIFFLYPPSSLSFHQFSHILYGSWTSHTRFSVSSLCSYSWTFHIITCITLYSDYLPDILTPRSLGECLFF